VSISILSQQAYWLVGERGTRGKSRRTRFLFRFQASDEQLVGWHSTYVIHLPAPFENPKKERASNPATFPHFVIEKNMSAAVAHRSSPRMPQSTSRTHSPMDKNHHPSRALIKSEGGCLFSLPSPLPSPLSCAVVIHPRHPSPSPSPSPTSTPWPCTLGHLGWRWTDHSGPLNRSGAWLAISKFE
jgi:hypothetical protein